MATRGRKAGIKTGRTGAQINSIMWRMCQLEVGERTWIEATQKTYAAIQRNATTISRLPELCASYRFSAAAFTAVSTRVVGQTHVVVAIERIK